jgi:hypothetical protein
VAKMYSYLPKELKQEVQKKTEKVKEDVVQNPDFSNIA